MAQGVCLPVQTTDFSPETDAGLGDSFLIRFLGEGGGRLDGPFEATGGLRIETRDGVLTAERANVDLSSDQTPIEVIGNVRFEGADFVIVGENGIANRATEEISFTSAGFELPARPARGSASDLVIRADQTLSLNDLIFTTCPEDDVDWELIARQLEIDAEAGFGTARGVRLKFKNVPFLWTPYLSFPVDDRRKSGFLTPRIAERDRTGFDVTVPYYLNLAPNYDLLLEPRYMSDRGAQLTSRFRYLMPATHGELNVEQIPDDRALNTSRHFFDLEHESLFGAHWQLVTGIEDVSDAAYFEDLGENLGVISQTHLTRFVDLAYYGPRWTLVTRAQAYQTIDDQIVDIDRPYKRVPQMVFRGDWGDRIVGFESTAEAVKFDRNIGETGWRIDSMQELSLRFARAGMYLTPAVGYRQTNYRIDRTVPGQETSMSRGLPITSLDSGLRFERLAGRERGWVQTIEPRMLYVRVPYEDQSMLPVFDTIVPDFNLVQLFSKYHFAGTDRIADTNQVSAGITTRLIRSATGRERLSATLGQTRYRSPRRVMLPDETAIDDTRSNYVAELGVALNNNWNLDLGYQWNGQTRQTVRAETRFEFRPEEDRLFGVGYRMREGLLEQGDLSVIWPVGERWRLIGQYSYSLLEEKPLERYAGIEYEACCWLVRLLSQHYIVRSTGQTDSSISFQLELKGLSQSRTTPDELLGRGILGYRRLN